MAQAGPPWSNRHRNPGGDAIAPLMTQRGGDWRVWQPRWIGRQLTMDDPGKTKERLLSDLARLRQKLAELEASDIALGIERHRTADALRTAEERMRFALEAAGVGIWDMHYPTGVLQWSGILESQYGLQPGTFGGTFESFVERIHPDDRESVLETLGKATKSGADFSLQHRSMWPDGTVRWLRGAGRIHLDAHGEPVRGVGISQDVTERKQAEAELVRLNDEIQRQRLRVFKATMRTVQEIVNNLLNGLQVVQIEAEGHLPAETLTLVDRMIQEASVKLKTLGDLETITEKEMALGLGIDYPGSDG